jgi:hypothetical protein
VNSYRVDVIADSSKEWVTNSIRVETIEEAKVYGADLAGRWRLVREWRVMPDEDPPNYKITDAGMEAIR